jgi:dihydrofolate reductase
MGRKTWESIGCKKLPNRVNVVVTRSNIEGTPDKVYYGDMLTLIDLLKREYYGRKIWFVGGADIYRQALGFCESIYLTTFPGDYDCDTFVPMDKYLDGYLEFAKVQHDDLTFSIWRRI